MAELNSRLEALERRLERAEAALRDWPPWTLLLPVVRTGVGGRGAAGRREGAGLSLGNRLWGARGEPGGGEGESLGEPLWG